MCYRDNKIVYVCNNKDNGYKYIVGGFLQRDVKIMRVSTRVNNRDDDRFFELTIVKYHDHLITRGGDNEDTACTRQ